MALSEIIGKIRAEGWPDSDRWVGDLLVSELIRQYPGPDFLVDISDDNQQLHFSRAVQVPEDPPKEFPLYRFAGWLDLDVRDVENAGHNWEGYVRNKLIEAGLLEQ
ncbi:MAG TPA: hypothetical protein VGK50_05810 [Coriobacteriia bacterium]